MDKLRERGQKQLGDEFSVSRRRVTSKPNDLNQAGQISHPETAKHSEVGKTLRADMVGLIG